MRVVVLGAGAIGCLLAARLHRARHEVLLVGREADVVAIRLHGVRVEGPDGGAYDVPAVDALTAGLSTEALLLAVKTPDLNAAGEEIARRLDPIPPILVLQNGLDVELDLLRALEAAGGSTVPGTVTRAVNSIPATRLGPGQVRPAGTGEILLERPDVPGARAAADRFDELLRSAKIPVRRVPEIAREVWRKLIVNAAINPVTADHRIPNGQLARDPWRGQAEALLAEARSVAAAEGFAFAAAELEADLWRIVRATAANRSSMLQDLDRGRPTEIEAISGAVLRRGAAHGLALPATERAYERIRRRAGRGATETS